MQSRMPNAAILPEVIQALLDHSHVDVDLKKIFTTEARRHGER